MTLAYSVRMIFFFFRAMGLAYLISEIHWGLTSAGEMYKGNSYTVQSASSKILLHVMRVIGTRQQLLAKLLLSFAWVLLVLRTSVKPNYCWGSYVNFFLFWVWMEHTILTQEIF